VLANFGFVMSDDELQSLIKTYGNDQNDIQYLDFINDANKLAAQGGDSPLTKTAYLGQSISFKGEDQINNLLHKIKVQVKKDRIRLHEFF
jgi:Ca2+-binding EF-hand superfamily protein